MTEPNVVSELPEFRLASSTGQTLSRESFAGKVPLALIFMTDLGSHGDVAVMDAVNQRLKEFGDRRSQVLGVVKDTARAVRSHTDQGGIRFPILADASGAMRRDFGIEPKERVVVIADKGGHIVSSFSHDPTHAEAGEMVTKILDTLDGL